jgi:hypothetical protein
MQGELMNKGRNVVLDEDMAKLGSALRRAEKQAWEIALQTNTPLVVYEGGRVIKKKVNKVKK